MAIAIEVTLWVFAALVCASVVIIIFSKIADHIDEMKRMDEELLRRHQEERDLRKPRAQRRNKK